ncbi:uncharacterized protein TNCV_1714641 [Trichonephila clavipes]|nr:uncharacterized protein TNCV_1714641 [Trichonephila clavipes]
MKCLVYASSVDSDKTLVAMIAVVAGDIRVRWYLLIDSPSAGGVKPTSLLVAALEQFLCFRKKIMVAASEDNRSKSIKTRYPRHEMAVFLESPPGALVLASTRGRNVVGTSSGASEHTPCKKGSNLSRLGPPFSVVFEGSDATSRARFFFPTFIVITPTLRQPTESFLTYCNPPMLLPLLQQPVLPPKSSRSLPLQPSRTPLRLTSSTCLTLTSNKILISINSMNFVFHPGLPLWYWARTRGKASHDPTPIPLGYRSHYFYGEFLCYPVSCSSPSGRFKYVLFILFVLSASAVYMGVANVFRCPASSETPIQVLIIGILACIVIILRTVNLKFQSKADLPAKPVLMVVTVLSAIATFSFFLAHGDRFNSCQGIYSQFGLAIHQNDHQARHKFVEWAQNEITVAPDFHKRILFSDEAHFWLNGYVNKHNCRIWSEANPQVYVETPLHPEKLTVWCALWAGGILLQKR